MEKSNEKGPNEGVERVERDENKKISKAATRAERV